MAKWFHCDTCDTCDTCDNDLETDEGIRELRCQFCWGGYANYLKTYDGSDDEMEKAFLNRIGG